MDRGKHKEVLCMDTGTKHYALEFVYIEEICREAEVSLMPGLPSYFQGVYNYKGSIIPVASVEEGERLLLIVVWLGSYQFGLAMPKETRLLLAEESSWMESPAENGGSGVWKEKAVIRYEEELFTLLDVERTIEGMRGEKNSNKK